MSIVGDAAETLLLIMRERRKWVTIPFFLSCPTLLKYPVLSHRTLNSVTCIVFHQIRNKLKSLL